MAFKPIQKEITEDQRRRARELYSFKNLKGSITKGKSNIFGALGEILIFDHYKSQGVKIDHAQHYDYDFLIGGYKVDIKTKKMSPGLKPRDDWRINIPAYNTKQKTDFYLWVNVSEDLKEAFFIGYIKKDVFFEEARFCEKGEYDRNGFNFRDDCYTATMEILSPLKRSLR